MLLDIPFITDWEAVREKRKLLINKNLRQSNQKRRGFDYQPGDQVLVRRPGILRKLNKPSFPHCQIPRQWQCHYQKIDARY